MNKITICYEVTDMAQFSQINPLELEHNGLKACAVRVGDAIEDACNAEDALESLGFQEGEFNGSSSK